MRQIATFISRIFEPMVGMSIVLFLAALQSGMSLPQSTIWFTLFVVPPTVLRLWAQKAHGLDWDIKDRSRRIVPLGILFGLVVVDLILLRLFGTPMLFDLFAFFLLWLVGFLLITKFFTKISGHTSGNALATGLIVAWFGWGWWPILAIVPLVAWSRVVTKNHTVTQVILGALYSWGLLFLML